MELITNSTVHCEYKLSKFDSQMGIWPYYGVINWYKHRIDSHRLKTAIQQIVDSVPILGGRLVKKLFSPLKVVCNPQKSGVGLIEIDLNEQEINIDNLLDSKTYVKNDFNIPEKSSDAINTDTPLVYVILNYNKNYYGITLLVNHIIADGGTYFKLLEHLSQAYEDPEYVAESEPLFTINFQKIDDFMSTVFESLSWKDKFLTSTFFIIFILKFFFQNKSDWSYLKCILTKEKLDLIKEATKNLPNGKSAYSTNDALFEFLSVVPIQRFSFPCNLRYRNVGIPENYLGNTEFIVSDLTKPSNNYMLKHTDVRIAINELRCKYSFMELFNSRYIVHNSWIKLQNYLPSFGDQLVHQNLFEFDDIILRPFAWKFSVIYRVTENEDILICLNLKNVVSQVEKKLRDFGVEDIILKPWQSSR